MTSQSYNNYYGDINLISDSFYSGQAQRYYKYILPIIESSGKSIADISILEIGSGPGYFANFCSEIHINNYIGLDLDHDIVSATGKRFPKYVFLCQNGIDFLKDYQGKKFDIIFLSHVFEHLSPNESMDIILGIKSHLSDNGVWINIMPNAASLNSGFLRYHDYTHHILYTDNSFNQLLERSPLSKLEAHHSNIDPVYLKTYHRYIFPISLFIRKIFLLMMGWYYPIYTNEILSVIKGK